MVDTRELLRAVEQVETLLNQSWDLAGDDFQRHRKEAIALRRLISDQTATIGKLGDAAFESPDKQNDFRRQFSATRSAMAFHHASWPIVSIDLESPEYLVSAKAMRKAYDDFIAWVKRAAVSA